VEHTLGGHERLYHLLSDVPRAQGPILIGGLHYREVEEFALLLIVCEIVVQYDVKLGIKVMMVLTGVLFEYISDKLVLSFFKSLTVWTS